jgi:hypothetical protein
MSDKPNRYTCKICGDTSSLRYHRKRHGENCLEYLKNNKKRGTILGFSSYWINMDTGVLYKTTGKMMKANINSRGNRTVNLTNDEGMRVKVNLDREWMKMKYTSDSESTVADTNRLLTAENRSLKRSISSELERVLLIYFADLHPNTLNRSVLSWTNYIMINDPTLERGLVRETMITLATGLASRN